MKSTTLRRFLSMHTWVGLLSGMALFIAFYAGAITVFVHELQGWAQPAERMPERAEAILSAQHLLDGFLAGPGVGAHDFFLTLPGEHGPRPQLSWFDPADAQQRRFTLAVDGQLQETPARAGFVEFIYDLHFTAGLPRTLGIYLFGLFCVLYGLALISGVVIYAPGFLKDLFALRLGHNLKRLWQDAHNVVGMLSLPFHVIFAWSGAVLTIGFVLLAPFQWLVFEGRLLEILESDFDIAPHVESAGVAAPMLPLSALIERAEAALPGITIESLSIHDAGDANAQVTLYGELPQRQLSGMGGVAINAVSGDIAHAMGPRDYPPGMAMLRGLQQLHYGNFGALTVKWLYFLLGLAGAFLFYSGNLLWIEARRKRRQLQQPVRTRLIAGLTLGVCLGCVAGVSATFLGAVWLPDVSAAAVYYLMFFVAMGWALLRRPAQAGHELLWLCVVLTAAIPFAGWQGSGEHLLMAFAQQHWHRFWIDVTALLMALAFARMAVATLRRARDGDPNSVWSLARVQDAGGADANPRAMPHD